MPQKSRMDAAGAAMLVGMAMVFAVGQISIKFGNEGFQPVFFAGLRSALAVLTLALWMRLRGIPVIPEARLAGPGVVAGLFFSAEFICLFLALDHNSVVRTTIIFYSMPVWLALGAHVLLPGDRITPRKALGLAIAFAGVAWALAARGDAGAGTLVGDLLSLGGALGWAGVALSTRASALARERPETQLHWQLLVSAPVLMAAALWFGPPLRDPGALAVAALAYHTLVQVTFGFLFWFWLLTVYPASGVASFGFLSPVFAIALGWAVLGEEVGPAVLGAGALVGLGIVLINRPPAPKA